MFGPAGPRCDGLKEMHVRALVCTLKAQGPKEREVQTAQAWNSARKGLGCCSAGEARPEQSAAWEPLAQQVLGRNALASGEAPRLGLRMDK